MKKITFSVLILLINLILADNSYALSADESCSDVSVVFARGSGSHLVDREEGHFTDQIKARLGSNISIHFYELGQEKYGDAQYPAVGVAEGFFGGSSLSAVVSGSKATEYDKSVGLGRTELEAYLQKRTAKCPNERIVLGGYSQGAQVIGESRLQAYVNNIDFIALFGDPKLYLPEGEGIYPDACRGKNFSAYRRVIGSCHTDNGSLGARKPTYMQSNFINKTGLWCNAVDYVCGSSKLFSDWAGHGKYASRGGAIDQAAQEIAVRLKTSLAKVKPKDSSGTPIDYDTLIRTEHAIDQGTTGKNVVFLIDGYESMKTLIPRVRAAIASSAKKIVAEGGTFAVGIYCVEKGGGYVQPFATYSHFFADYSQATDDDMNDVFAAIQYHCNYPLPRTPNSGLYQAAPLFEWQHGATKSIILFTNYPSTDVVTPWHASNLMVSQMMLEIDPVNVYPVVSAEAEGYQELADITSGQVTMYSEANVEAATENAVQKVVNRPVPFLKNVEYIANPGQEITFDASDSYVIGSSITTYDWDFDGDGIFDATTTTPMVNHTYDGTVDGIMQVRVTAANGLIANASATVRVGTYQPPALPKAPTNIKTTISAKSGGKSTVTLTWRAGDATATRVMVKINDVPLGITEKDRASLEITDVDRAADVTITLAGVTADGMIGSETAIVSVPKDTTPEKTSWWDVLVALIKKVVQAIVPKLAW